jgi:hypothetical protein
MYIDAYVERVELRDAKEKRTGRREMVRRGRDESRQGTEGIEAVGDVNEAFFEVFTRASPGTD